MTEDEVRVVLRDQFNVSRETVARLEQFAAMVVEENARQNLISAGSIPDMWSRHILDSAQLLRHAPQEGLWLDLGTGAGFPGIVIAIMRDQATVLVESRRKRIDFLQRAVDTLGLTHVRVVGAPLEKMETTPVDVISARAFAPLDKLLMLAHRFSRPGTLWLLPKGKSAREELAAAQNSWQGVFRVEPSMTDSEAAIIVARDVQPKGTK